MNQDRKRWLLVAVSALAVAALYVVGPIPQAPGYHQFADSRNIAAVGNFWNVVSNLPFLLAGVFGLARYSRLAAPESKSGYLVLCVGVCLVAFGSAYYHLSPSNLSLLWDRLPMTVVFMALLGLLLGERVTNRRAALTFWLLVALGVSAALYWYWTESQGRGDLRPYVLVQFLPLVLMPLILLLYPPRYIRGSRLVFAFALYLLAKVCEYYDQAIFQATQQVSGHALKHFLAALAALCILTAIPVRPAFRGAVERLQQRQLP